MLLERREMYQKGVKFISRERKIEWCVVIWPMTHGMYKEDRTMPDLPSKRSIRELQDFSEPEITEVSSKSIKWHKREIFVKSAKPLPRKPKPPKK